MASAWLYDALMTPLEKAGLARARQRLLAGVRGRVLELGAGTGLSFASYPAPPAAAIDVDLDALRRARLRDPRVALVQADAEALPFKEGSFDAVVDSLSLCSVGDPAAALSEARRVLKTGGELRLLEHVRPRGPILGWIFDRLAPPWLWITGGCHLDRRTAELVEPAGFTVSTVRFGLRGIGCQVRARR
jgi:ubiquinone/menaquinone biosynthesis C-methylase UbiE